jgi:hypothetical protein
MYLQELLRCSTQTTQSERSIFSTTTQFPPAHCPVLDCGYDCWACCRLAGLALISDEQEGVDHANGKEASQVEIWSENGSATATSHGILVRLNNKLDPGGVEGVDG